MGKDFKINSEINQDLRSDGSKNIRSDFGSDLAKEEGVDLNAGSGDAQLSDKVNKQGIGLKDENEKHSHSGQRIVDVIPSNIENERLENEYRAHTGKDDFKPPYTPDTMVFEVELDKPNTFTQAHSGENPKEDGSWYADPNDIHGMSADEYKDSFALPQNPTHASDYELGEGTKLMVGEVNNQEDWGEGGGKQYYTDESENKDLISTRPFSNEDDNINEETDENLNSEEPKK